MVMEPVGSPGDEYEHFRSHMGPGHVDQMVRHLLRTCWLSLPPERRNVDEVERQVRRILDRALRDLREDDQAFGMGNLD